jgi:mannosyltransferase
VLVRLPGLSQRTITHPEFYLPGIEIPEGVKNPRPRKTLVTTIQSVFSRSDIHPPGFYLHSLAWTHLFGTSEIALRLPSVLAGTATIALLFRLAWRTDGPVVAAAASLRLALHGFHVSKSIQAELWIWPAFWAVLSVWLLHGLLERTSKPRALAYLMVLTIGLWSEYSFWLFAAIQIAYVAIRTRIPSPFWAACWGSGTSPPAETRGISSSAVRGTTSRPGCSVHSASRFSCSA